MAGGAVRTGGSGDISQSVSQSVREITESGRAVGCHDYSMTLGETSLGSGTFLTATMETDGA